jgi:hypothetical protein
VSFCFIFYDFDKKIFLLNTFRKRRNSFDRCIGSPRSINNSYLDSNNEQHYIDPNKRFRNRSRSRSRSNTKENFEENIRLHVKQRLSINNSNDSNDSSDRYSIISTNGSTDFQTTGLRITINNDKYLLHSDSNNNIIHNYNQQQNYNNFHEVINNNQSQFQQTGNIHSRIQPNPTFVNKIQKIPPLLPNPVLLPPILQPQEIKQRNFNNSNNNNNKRDYHNNNNISIDCRNKFNNKNKNNQQNSHWSGSASNNFNLNKPQTQTNTNEVPIVKTNRPNIINLDNSQENQKDTSKYWEETNSVKKIIKTFDKIPVDTLNKTKISTPKDKTFNNTNLNAFKIQKITNNFDNEMWDDDDQFTAFGKDSYIKNSKNEDNQQKNFNNKFNYTDRNAPSSFKNCMFSLIIKLFILIFISN